MNYAERVLPSDIIAIVEDKLAQGHSLSKILLARVRGRPIRVRSFLPRKVSDKVALRIDTGGIYKGEQPSAKADIGAAIARIDDRPSTFWLVDQIVRYFDEWSDACLFFEHALARRRDPYLSNRHSDILYYGDEVLFVVHAKGSTEQRIHKAIKESYSIPIFIGALSRPGDQFSLRTQDLVHSDLEEIALRAEAIIIGAYDGEGFLLCDELPASQ